MTGEEKLKEAVKLYSEAKHKEMLEKTDVEQLENCKFSKRFERRMNRMFREVVGTDRIPHPEVDNAFERLRSKLVIKFKK